MGESKVVSESQVIMTELVLPSHTNQLGTVFGGKIMSWIDIAAAISAQRHAGKPVVTASIDGLDFIAPAQLGWVVNLKASVNRVFNTSMEVGVRVDSENPITGENYHTATAYLTFVALDSHKRPTIIRQVEPETEKQKIRFEKAENRRELRLKRKDLTRS
ncbi:MAG: acyl-CoA thioesterase [Bdellovibrionota bacterium]|tara:strand:+ start:41366 stop:41845 length:480 start_codon:yes stop_codon:yes gene_type:complete